MTNHIAFHFTILSLFSFSENWLLLLPFCHPAIGPFFSKHSTHNHNLDRLDRDVMFLFSPSHRSTVRLSRTMHHVVPVVPDRPTRVAPEAKQNQSCTHSTVHRPLAYRSYQLSTQLDRDAACSTISIQMAKRQTTQ